jgi:hypothetical protein
MANEKSKNANRGLHPVKSLSFNSKLVLCATAFAVAALTPLTKVTKSPSPQSETAIDALNAQYDPPRQFNQDFQRRPVAVREDYPQWQLEEGFGSDCFTFVRIQFDTTDGGFRRGRGGQSWQNDFPDSDWNFSFRLQQLTSLKVDPNGRVLRLTDAELFDYPFIFLSNVQDISLSRKEVESLRRYLLSGGFMMADDFWTPAAWRHVQREFAKVFPDRQPIELGIDHELFHCVYDLKSIPRVPSILAWRQGDMFEHWHGDSEGDEDPHFHAYTDDNGRVMALFCLNNDIGDGWEREGDNAEYFEQFSVKYSYPLGINIVTYAMTH